MIVTLEAIGWQEYLQDWKQVVMDHYPMIEMRRAEKCAEIIQIIWQQHQVDIKFDSSLTTSLKTSCMSLPSDAHMMERIRELNT